jgi:hypothetical protein
MFTMALLASNPTKISVWGYNHDVTGSTVLSTGIWYHIAITYNALDGELKSYINGAIDINTTTTDYTTSLGTVEIGRAGTDEFNGKIDEIGIWNEALTSAEITALYNSGSGLSPSSNSGDYSSSSNLQAYWNFNEGSGTALTDQTTNGNNGTITGATWSEDVPISIEGGFFSTYTFNVTDTVDAAITVSVAAAVAADQAGNTSPALSPYQVVYNGIAPDTPADLAVTAGNEEVTLAWSGNTEGDFSAYRIFGGTSSNPTTLVDSSTVIGDTSLTITGLSNYTEYFYRITAVDTVGNESDYSQEISVIPYGFENVFSINLDGNNDNIKIDNDLSITDAEGLTFTCWVRSTGQITAIIIISWISLIVQRIMPGHIEWH